MSGSIYLIISLVAKFDNKKNQDKLDLNQLNLDFGKIKYYIQLFEYCYAMDDQFKES